MKADFLLARTLIVQRNTQCIKKTNPSPTEPHYSLSCALPEPYRPSEWLALIRGHQVGDLSSRPAPPDPLIAGFTQDRLWRQDQPLRLHFCLVVPVNPKTSRWRAFRPGQWVIDGLRVWSRLAHGFLMDRAPMGLRSVIPDKGRAAARRPCE